MPELTLESLLDRKQRVGLYVPQEQDPADMPIGTQVEQDGQVWEKTISGWVEDVQIVEPQFGGGVEIINQ